MPARARRPPVALVRRTPHPLDLGALTFRVEPALVGAPGRSGRASLTRHDKRLRDDRLKADARILAIAVLGAIPRPHDRENTAIEPLSQRGADPFLLLGRESVTLTDRPGQLDPGVARVHMLAPRPRSTRKTPRELALRHTEPIGALGHEDHDPTRPAVARTSTRCCPSHTDSADRAQTQADPSDT